jgi:hypothetical protein
LVCVAELRLQQGTRRNRYPAILRVQVHHKRHQPLNDAPIRKRDAEGRNLRLDIVVCGLLRSHGQRKENQRSHQWQS